MASNVQSPREPAAPATVRDGNTHNEQNPPERSVTDLVSGIMADAQHLVRQQITMFRQEIRADLRKSRNAALSLTAGIGITLIGGILLTQMLAFLLHSAAPALPLWACFGIVGGVFGVMGGLVVYAGVRKFETLNPLSEASIEALKENLTWTTSPK
jgi:putative superfamily III holin-X